MISVVIPAWNAAMTLDGAVESVLIQKLCGGTRGAEESRGAASAGPKPSPLEIIIVDDGSSDDTAAVADALARRNPGLIHVIRQRNEGPSAARNAGIAAAKGDYIAFLDADDEWLPGKLQAQLRLLEDDPDIDLVSTAMNGRRFARKPWRFWLSFEALLPNNLVYTSSVLVKKSALLAAGGFNEKRRLSEDFELWLRIAKRGKIFVLNEPLIRYRHRAGISADLWPMERSELATYALMREEGWVSGRHYTLLRWWSILKYLMRKIRSRSKA